MKGELLLMQSDGNRDAARAEFERAMSTARSQGATSIEERAAASLQKATVAGRFDKQTA